MKNSIVHFEIPADNIERAKKFYEKIFGWEIKEFPMPEGEKYFSVITTEMDEKTKMPKTPGAINGGMMERKNSGQRFMNYINVESIDKMLKTIQANGGKICMEKQEISPNMGWIAVFQDTEGNMMGLHEAPKDMKK